MALWIADEGAGLIRSGADGERRLCAQPLSLCACGNTLVCAQAQQAAVLVVGGFLSNPEELEKLQEESYQQALAQAIASGLQNYYNRGEEQEMQAADHAAGQESANE